MKYNLPLETAIEHETHARHTLADLIETQEKEIANLKSQLKAERDLRSEIAADLRKISELFNQLIAA
jgi:septal ring factor EnvC (AmiA/AmiB activator)